MRSTLEEHGHIIIFRHVTGQDMVGEVRELLVEYARSLDIDLCFQDFETELRTLPGKFGPPDGTMILAFVDDKVAGCAALRKISEDICEMKRLFVRDDYKGYGIGKRLAAMIIEEATKMHYRYIRLDTLPTMTKALNLYKSLGFYDIEPYIYNPIEGARYMELELIGSDTTI